MAAQWQIPLLVVVLSFVGMPAHAQLGRTLGGGLGNTLGGSLGRLPDAGVLQGPIGAVNRTAGGLAQDVNGALDTVNRDIVGRPTQARILERDPQGASIVRREILAVSPSAESLAIARRLNFTILRQDTLDALGLTSATLQPPEGMNEASALAALRASDPGGSYDFAHIYNPTGDGTTGASGGQRLYARADSIRIGMIDGGVEKQHPALATDAIITKAFAGVGVPPASQHGTAIASLLVGKDGSFNGYLPGAKLYAADVFGGAPDGGSAADIARALNWLAENQIPVTNISLAGPPNALLAAAVKAFVASGHVLVAAVGNDGPAAPPNYPAAYDGVIGVTSVDAGGRLEIDSNRNAARFAARGVNIRTANMPRGYANVTGTSYAVPAVAAQLSHLMDKPDSQTVLEALVQLSHNASPVPGTEILYLAAPDATLAATQ